MGESMSGTQDLTLHILRNPYGWSEDDVRAARLAAADRIELLERQHVTNAHILRLLDEVIPYRLQLIAKGECVDASVETIREALTEVRGALSKVQQQPDCAREPGALTQPAITRAERDLLDTDGENLAVRWFLAMYGGTTSPTVGQMRRHLEACGFPCWPEWAAAPNDDHLTKGGAQDWLRYLFELETRVLYSGRVRDASAKADSADSQKGFADQPEQSK
jgi:hypothetical protein